MQKLAQHIPELSWTNGHPELANQTVAAPLSHFLCTVFENILNAISQNSRCKSSLSKAATFWLASSGCPYASARLRNMLSRTMSEFVQKCNVCLFVTEVTQLLRIAAAKARWAKQPLWTLVFSTGECDMIAQDSWCKSSLNISLSWAEQMDIQS